MSNRRFIRAGLVVSLLVGAIEARGAGKGGSAIDFNREIRPILSDNCFACHGPDDKERKAKLRFDIKEDAFKPAKSGDYAIVPGNPAKSHLIERVTSKDPDDVMPPPKTGKKLTPQQIDLLKRWIAQGAPWQEHWAFVKPERPPLPKVKNAKAIRNDIDRFVNARLEKEGLKPSPEAPKRTLIRRAAFDLTGLPPTPEEVDAFLADKDPQAYEKVVDRLLNSSRYGEHMARYWLDAARYADTHGYHIDSERRMWKYRDWLIDAFNQNVPFDQFTLWQLAGDLLPNPNTEQKIASGYVRCNMSTGEGGAIVEEYQTKYTFDRVETTATIWMGLTLTCARCHTHKYDPITHREYYGLYHFFNNLDESVMDGNKPNPDPFLKLPSEQQAQRQETLKKEIEKDQASLEKPMPELDKAQIAWQQQWNEKLNAGWTVHATTNVTSTNGSEFKLLEDKSILVEGGNPEQDIHEIVVNVEPGTIAALRLEALPHESLPKKSSARAEDGRFRLSEIEAELLPASEKRPDKVHEAGGDEAEEAKEKKQPKPKKLKLGQAVADTAEANYEIEKAFDGKADTGWGIAADAVAEPHSALFLLSDPVKVETNSDLRVRLKYEASKSKRAIGRFRIATAQNEELVELLNPAKFTPWQVVGPFKAENLKTALKEEYPPEKEIDLKKKFDGVREEISWKEKTDFEDGKANLLVNELHGVHGVYYLYRTLKVPTARKIELSLRADDVFRVWVNGKQVAERASAEKPGEGPLKATVDLKKGENKFLLKVVNHVGAAYFTFNSDAQDTNGVPADVAAILATTRELKGNNLKKVRNHYRRQNSTEFKTLFDQVEKMREEESALEKAIPTTMVAKDSDKPRETVMLMRGEYDKKGEKVPAGVPAILPPLPKDAPTNRLGLAKWLLDPSHPLTARVTVNRFWQQYFGVGLVKTTEDFGVQGERPSHPELLDWLATEFIQSGWDVKHLQRLILTSATYRQHSKVTPELLAKDPENRLLARGPRFRMDAEVVRDTALALGGLLVEQQGGRSVKPYEPPGLWEAVSFNNSQKYVQDKGEAQYRRSLYTFWKRQSPPPNMLIFDAPTREYCVVRRLRTNTPLQALALMNDPQFVEASRGLGYRMMTESSEDPVKRIAYGFRLATCRNPSPEETQVLVEVFNSQLTRFKSNKEDADKLLKIGSFQPEQKVDSAEWAAWSIVASMILNLDETITKG